MEESEEQSDGQRSDTNRRKRHSREERFRLHLVTWNVATADPPDDLSSLLHLDSVDKPDLYVLGLQEVYAAPLRFVSDTVYDDPWSRHLMSILAPLQYMKVTSVRMQGLVLVIFSKLEHVPFIKDIQATYTRTGIYHYWGNKGAVSVRLSFYGHMLCFLNCHLAAHMQYAKERMDEFEYIMDSQKFESQTAPRIVDHRVVFWLGDLNFRIQDHDMHFIRSCIKNHDYSLLWSKDQLTMMKKEEEILREFEEGPLEFPPTYKFDVNSENYDSRLQGSWFGFNGKKRKPAWTDRILWRVRLEASPEEKDRKDDSQDPERTRQIEEEAHPLKVTQELYTSNMKYGVSDHKPVVSVFNLQLKKMYETPLVQLRPEGEWSADMDALVVYTQLQPFPSSSWDWIGLYRVGFTSVSDYITYSWVKDDEVSSNKEAVQIYVNKEEIPVRGGDCVLCFYSSALNCIIGISEPFKVRESRVAIEEGLLTDKLKDLDLAVAAEDAGGRAVKDSACSAM
ncbi:inositol polyphosphate 5-phosphatase K-like isoform X3 [Nelusetta ayraudi]|uniref:inositol polyphosphate 5-phosphatase K-like isoform X3 n=1 Tax=Nelusetta ayraudi TaxID=303726 RepID=UPI003F71AF86